LTEFTSKEKKFLASLEEARIATVHDGIPHVKPVSYIFHSEIVLIATDYNTRTLKNLKNNPNVAVTIDVYKSGQHKAVCIQGTIEIVENGMEFQEIYKMFHEKFAWVRNEPWSENEAPFLKIIPKSKISWGLKE
jgi:nitroimidazol reductase NimA-like FMN-containing flavoprotein (pyridoxamine 5'-phosphate oxidase superfamily)